MSSLKAKDRVSLCLFTFSDGRRCRTPRIAIHPHFCFYHAQKESQAHAAETLGKDLAYFFSGDYLSACDLSTALARLIPAVIRGDVKPKTARTVAYMFQTLLQSIHVSQDEYINAFSTDGWRKSIRNSVKENDAYRFPPDPEQSESLQPQPESQPQLRTQPQPQTQAHQPAPAPPSKPRQPAPHPFSTPPQTPSPVPTPSHAPQNPAARTTNEPIPATQAAPTAPAPQPNNSPQIPRPNPQPNFNRDTGTETPTNSTSTTPAASS
jgi:hypothetical protein